MTFAKIDSTENDDFLAEVASKSLSIGPTDVKQSDMNAYRLPSKTHVGLYSNTLTDELMEASSSIKSVGEGVPGFPDFPSFWDGGETSSIRQEQKEKWKQAIRKNIAKRQQRQSRCRFRRNAINHINYKSNDNNNNNSISIGKQQKLWLKERRRRKKIRTILKMENKVKSRKDMVSLKQAMSTLTFT